MTNTDHIIEQFRALVQATEALNTIEPSGWFERAIVRLLLAAYEVRLKAILPALPEWMVAKIMDTSKDFEEDNFVIRISHN